MCSVERRVEGQGVHYSSLAQGEEEEVLEARVAFEDGHSPAPGDNGEVPSTDNGPDVRPSLLDENRPLSSAQSATDEFDLRMDLTS